MATEGEYRNSRVEHRDETRFDDEPLPALLSPTLLHGLAADDDRTTHTAGYGLFLLARTHDAAIAPLATELAGRLVVDERDRAVRRTLASLRLVDDAAVREALLDSTADDRARRLYASVRETNPWNPPAPLSDGDHAEYLTAFRQLVEFEDDEPDDSQGQSVTDVIESDEDSAEEAEDTDETTDEPRDAGPPSDDTVGTTKRERIDRLTGSEAFAMLVHRSGFDDLQVVTPKRTHRYADVFRARARADDTERGVAVRLLHTPDESDIDATVGDQLASWARLVESSGVVTVVDWGTTPQPWVATECVAGHLPDRGRVGPAAALAWARDLTAALVVLHQQDVVHAGIDPQNVVYADSQLDERVRPMLDNVGLLTAYRRAFNPRDYLDPRYAAPEYFDSQYGRIDHATDIYQLGMVVYRLLAGRHPFDGSYSEIRSSVLDDRPTAPSECTPALPAAVDEVVAKATAKQKLTRYETVHGFHQDITRICDAVLD
ncbi:serine/threonine protein kinase [Salinibaculum salinum]|uniref:serine/threonine protein kinase n=1 Tax=Salinibaculum salinum TaxID=3131996 RepID=UPI0030EC9524